MPFDDREFPTRGPTRGPHQSTADRRWVATWLLAVAAMVFVMVILGGATRLTGSGLSIMEWAPIAGALPPLSEAEWQRLFSLYKEIPQYSLLHANFSLADFKHIFWLEWVHRLWGRLIGIAFIVPLVVFAVRRMIPRRAIPQLLLLFVMGGLQGAVGWFMVASGFFPDTTAVAPIRLVVHLALALALYGALLWFGMSFWSAEAPSERNRAVGKQGVTVLAGLLVCMVALTIMAGGLVAGLHAGLDYNTFPLMGGRLVPAGYAALTPFPRNLTQNVAAVQFDHRLLATATAVLALLTVVIGFLRGEGGAARNALVFLGIAVCAQYGLGVATLVNIVPVDLAITHQAMAVILLTAALVTLFTQRAKAR